jgi:hypothetical protein
VQGRRLVIAVIWAALALAAPERAAADDPSFLTTGIGVFDIDDDETAGLFEIEYRTDLRLWFIKPLVGAFVTTDGSFYGYGGFNIDLYFGRRWVFSPGFAVGGYAEGDGKDLGHTIEFRSGAELAYRFSNRARLGVGFHHISNASLDDRNPGTEILAITYSIPFGYVFGSR